MSNNQALTTVDKVNLLLGSLPICFNCMGGAKLSTLMRYTMEVTSIKPYTLTVYHLSSKTIDGRKQAVKNEILTLTAQQESIKVNVTNDLPLTGKEVFNTFVNDVDYKFTSHREVVQLLAIPYWVENASTYVQTNSASPMWLVIATLIMKTTKLEGTELHDHHATVPFTVEQFNESLRQSSKQLPDNPQLKNAVIQLDKALSASKTVDTKAVESAKTTK